MIILNLTQGTPEWHAARATHDCASEAAAALGLAKNCTRSNLMKIKHTGITPDVSEWTQTFLFDKGHEAEALARPIVAKILGKAMHPVTGESDDGKLLASLDGFTTFGDLVWENKTPNAGLVEYITTNNDLPDTHWPQCEHQLLVTGADRVYFTVSDGTEEGTTGIFYESNPERRQRLIAGWAQFNEDLKAYKLPESKQEVFGVAPDALPALRIEVTGMVTASNLEQFKAAALSVFRGINTTLTTDQEFADAEKAVKFCKDAEEKLEAAKNHALSQTESIDALFKTIDAIKEEARAVRLKLDKLVKSEKENRKADIVATAKRAFAEHYAGLADRIGFAFGMAHVDFASAIAGLKSLDSMRDKVSVAMANAKIDADAIAELIQANQATVGDMSLMPDFPQVCTKLPEDFAALLAMRVAQRKEAEEKRIEAERQRIRAEEQAKAQREADAKIAAERAEAKRVADAEQAERDRIAAEEIRKLDAECKAFADAITAGSGITKITADESGAFAIEHVPVEQFAQPAKTMNLGQINAALGFTVTADFLAGLGVTPVRQEKTAKLYDARKLPTICRLIQEHLAVVMVRSFREAA